MIRNHLNMCILHDGLEYYLIDVNERNTCLLVLVMIVTEYLCQCNCCALDCCFHLAFGTSAILPG